MPFYLYTGRGPSSAAPRLKVLALLGVHRLRHVAPFLRGVSLAASNSLVPTCCSSQPQSHRPEAMHLGHLLPFMFTQRLRYTM